MTDKNSVGSNSVQMKVVARYVVEEISSRRKSESGDDDEREERTFRFLTLTSRLKEEDWVDTSQPKNGWLVDP
jgi:hypothetical protein